jgi:hypothetical protein
MITERVTKVIHTAPRCSIGVSESDMEFLKLLAEMHSIEEEHGPIKWILRQRTDEITPHNVDGKKFYFEAIPDSK